MIITFDLLNSWSFPNPFPKNIRSKTILDKYNNFKNSLDKNDIKIEDYILNKFLKNKSYNLILNNYPYNLDENMTHYVLWIHPDYVVNLTNKKIHELLNNKMIELNCNQYFCFENNIQSKSVQGVLHYQVFFGKC